jgi:hypothetical protein
MGHSTQVQKCRHPECPVGIRMLLYLKTGRPAPIEARPSPEGNIHVDLEQGTYIILRGDELEQAHARGIPLHLNHFVTCAFARQFSQTTVTSKPAEDHEALATDESDSIGHDGLTKLSFDEGDVYEHAGD